MNVREISWQEELARIVESSEDAIIGKTLDGTIISWNPGAETMYGYSADEAIGKPVSILIPPDHPDEMPQILERLKRGERIEHYEATRIRKDGTRIYVSLATSPIKDAEGEIIGASTIARDVTERTKAEEQLSRLAAIVESSEDAVIGKTLDGIIISWNPGAENVYGYTAAEVIGKPVSILIPPDHPDEMPQILERLKRGERIEHYEATRVRKDGTEIFVSLAISPIKDAGGTIIGASTIARDVTERKKIQEEARATSLYARSLIEASLDPLVTISPEGKITDVNKATELATGQSRDHLIGSDFSEYFTEPDKARAGYRQVLSEGLVIDYPLAIRHKSGRVTDVLYNAAVYKNEAGEMVGVFAAARDVTERTKAEEQLSRLAAIVESSEDAVIGKTLDGIIISWNPGAKNVYGYTAAEVIGKPVSILIPPDYPDEIPQLLNRIKLGERIDHYEATRVRKDGTEIFVSLAISPIKDAGGTIIGASTIARDVTERKKAEEALRATSLYARSLIEASLDPLVTISPEGKITDVNKATELATGQSRDHLIGSDFSEYFTEPDKARAGYQQVLSAGLVIDYPLAIRHSSGKITSVLYNATVYKNEAGEMVGVFAAARDVTERDKAEEQARIASLYARSLIEASLDPLVTISPEGKITDVNKATESVTGQNRDHLIGSDFSEYFTEPDKARAGYQQVLSEGLVIDYPLAIRHDSGKITDVLYNATVYKNEAGDVVGVFAAARDVTERKKAEEQVQVASLYARSLIEASLDPLVTISPEGKITDVNKATESVTGQIRDHLIGSDFSEYFTEPEKARAGYQQVLSEGLVIDYPLAIRHDSGKITDVLYNATVYKNEAGDVVGVFAAARDVTERKRTEEQLSRLAAIVESSEDAVIGKTLDGIIISWNPGAENIYGFTAEEVVGKPVSILIPPDHPDEVPSILERIKRGERIDHYETVRIRKDGQYINISTTISPIKNADGEIIGASTIARDVTERKKAEEALRAASLYARSLIEASLDPLVTISPEGKITDVNKATESVTGQIRDHLIGSDFSEYFTEPEKARAGYQQVLSEGLVIDYPLAIRHDSGKITDVLYNAAVYKNEAGEMVGVFAAARDVTERKRAEEEVRTTSLYARSLIEASLDPLVTISPEGKITDVNKATELVTGQNRDHLIGSDFSEYFTEADKARAGYQQVLAEGLVIDYPLAIRHASGKITDVLYNAVVYKNEAGDVVGVFAAARDVTERKRAEDQAQVASLYARSLIEASLDPLVTISPKGKITDVNEATELVTGQSRDHLIGSVFSEYFTEAGKAEAGYQQVLAEGLVRDYPLAIRHASGKITDVLYNATLYKNEADDVVGVFAAARDVTERKRAEEEVRTTSLYARSLIEASLDPLVTISPEGKITDVNKATELVTGQTRDHLIGSDFSEYFTEPDNARAGYQQVLAEGLVIDYPLAIRHASGKITDVLYNAVVYKNEAGDVVGVFAAARDVTERKKDEERIINLNKSLEHTATELSAINKELEAFSYSVSHDLSAPLRSLDGFSQAILDDYAEKLDDDGRDFLKRIRKGSQRMAQLIDDMLKLSRITRGDMQRETVDLSAIVETIAAEFQQSEPERQVEFIIAKDVVAGGDPRLIRMALDNLLGNALKFTGKRKSAKIEFGVTEQEGKPAYFVRDNGAGFDMNYASKLFGAFQRLHAATEFPGTGIGLAIVQRIIHRHGGRVWANSRIGKGATFYFTL